MHNVMDIELVFVVTHNAKMHSTDECVLNVEICKLVPNPSALANTCRKP